MSAPSLSTQTVRAGWVLYATQTLGWTWAEAKESFDAWLANQPSEQESTTMEGNDNG